MMNKKQIAKARREGKLEAEVAAGFRILRRSCKKATKERDGEVAWSTVEAAYKLGLDAIAAGHPEPAKLARKARAFHKIPGGLWHP